ncbi:hypothetical protein GGR52DRAFT_562138 [Hypoxylon sp. FL1284]|nr:hypothetical protein GGR52DRAFT_562138 [Hypoxylon sp. FL1284]
MLEYFTYKKVKKHREEKAEKQQLQKEKDAANTNGNPTQSSSSVTTPPTPGEARPILDQEDEKFLERLTSPSAARNDDDDETPPPLPPRVKTPVIDFDSDASSYVGGDDNGPKKPAAKDDGKGKSKEDKAKAKHHDKDNKPKRFSFANVSLRRKPTKKEAHLSVPADAASEREVRREETDVEQVLDDLNLAAARSDGDAKAFSLSRESAETVRKFTQVLKDLVNGVPTAYGDLVRLIEDRDAVLARSYEKLPRSLQKLVARLPDKLTSSLGPELLAVAAEAQGLAVAEGAEGSAKKLLSPGNLMELVTKPGAVAGLLKGIVNALKARWPAFVGTNVLWSVAVFLLLSALWYCYKRGRDTRLAGEKEAADVAAAGVEDRVVEEVGEASPDGVEGKQIAGAVSTGPRIEEPVVAKEPVPAAAPTSSAK